MGGKVRRLGSQVSTGQEVAQGWRLTNPDGVSRGDEASRGEGGRKQNQEKRGKEGFLKLRHLRSVHRATGQGRVSDGEEQMPGSRPSYRPLSF